MKTKWIIPAALLLALTLTSTANAGPNYKVKQVGGSHFGFFFGSPGFGFNYGRSYGPRHFRPYKPWRQHPRHWRHGGLRGGWRGWGPGPRFYRPRQYYSEHHHYYNDRRTYSAPAPAPRQNNYYQDTRRDRSYNDGPAMHLHMRRD
ncbi:MAG: hypothetical protein G3M70_02225 [Candidatus Nitronauta litoralis]|uniref:Uncharacterized protein n=1 Tax=Candidatus Nitronauta litoralis TaxID=2705533 RepID=A0A7T0BTK9_9BACT|nr:MAG: hypothetical protein G3M70_02225 [Candidatus Nitronauta litoralis]